MKKRPLRPKQVRSDELAERILNIIETKFYRAGSGPNGRAARVAFAKDRRLLLQWVVFWPADWLDQRGVTLPPDRYEGIFREVLMEAAVKGNLDAIKYLPAWLAQTVQSHWRMHGEEYYEEAKSMRTLVEHALVFAGRNVQAVSDPIREMAAQKRLMDVARGKKKSDRRAGDNQLTML